MRSALLTLALAACGSSSGSSIDAGPPDAEPVVDESRIPFEASGTTPEGAFTAHYARFTWYGGDCLTGYGASFFTTNLDSDADLLRINVPVEYMTAPTTATLPAELTTIAGNHIDVTFEITHLDAIPAEHDVRFAGHISANSDGWLLDTTFDQPAAGVICL